MRGTGIILCDTTLRDGEQAPGAAFPSARKLAIATILDKAGVGEIEAGTPICGGDEFAAVKAIAGAGLKAKISGWCRAREDDIKAAKSSGVSQVAIAVPASGIHLSHKMRRPPSWALDAMTASARMARDLGLEVVAALEDASRADQEMISMLIKAAGDEGAKRVRISDTLGVLDPTGSAELVIYAAKCTKMPIEFHGHNDYGLATANTLSAARAGATHLSVTVLGLGERAGNAPLEEVALCLEKFLKTPQTLDFTILPELFAMVAEASGRPVPPGKPVAGSGIFTHESGIHADGLIKNPLTYEPYPPEKVGGTRKIVLGKHSGRGAVRAKLLQLGISPGEEAVAALLKKVRDISIYTGRGITDDEFSRLLGKR